MSNLTSSCFHSFCLIQMWGWKWHHHNNGALSLSNLTSSCFHSFYLIQMWGWKWHHHTNGALSLSNLTSNCFHSFCLIHNSWVESRQANTEAPFQHNICGSISCKQIIVYRAKKETLHGPCHMKTCLRGFRQSYIQTVNLSPQLQRLARKLKFGL